MFDDERDSINKVRGDYSKNHQTTLGRGRNLVSGNSGILMIGLLIALGIGVLKFNDVLLLTLYGGAPFVFDSALFLDTLPIVGRLAPRVTLLFEVGTLGISIGVVYKLYRAIGAIDMGVSYYISRKK